MSNKVYGFIGLTGGGTGKLDAIDGSVLADGDIAIGADSSNSYVHKLVAASGVAESSPFVISPDTNAGTKRWHLERVITKDGITIYDGTNVGNLQFTTNALELYSERASGVTQIMVKDAGGNKETAAKFTGAGAAELYYDNAKKVETTATGIQATGRVLSTTNDVFAASITADQSNVTGDGTSYAITGAIWTTIFDRGGSSFSNGTFTAPVTGYYLLGATLRLEEIAAGHTGFVFWLVSNAVIYYFAQGNSANLATGGTLMINGSQLVSLTAGQTATINVNVSGGTKVVDVGTETTFWGMLVL